MVPLLNRNPGLAVIEFSVLPGTLLQEFILFRLAAVEGPSVVSFGEQLDDNFCHFRGSPAYS